MNDYLPKSELEPDDGGKKPVSNARLAIWLAVGGFAVYMIVSGIIGIVSK
ncbi:hypothetical protein [Leifsonia sp. Leaf264]|nr:hypothetical protein [Leifsonia sp. Leaf264]